MGVPVESHGTLLQRKTKVCSHAHSGIIGSNNGILWTAVTEGTGGDLVNIHIVDPGGTAALSIAVVGVAIHINLATNTGAIISTAAQVIAAVQADSAAGALVTPCNDGASTGAGVMAAVAEFFLASGSNTETWTTIAEVRDLSGPNFSRGTIETTNHDSPGAWKEYILGTKENGEVSFGVNFVPTNDTHDPYYGLVKDFQHNVLRTYQLIFPDATTTTWGFTGYLTAFGTTAPVEGVLAANISIKLSGAPTLE